MKDQQISFWRTERPLKTVMLKPTKSICQKWLNPDLNLSLVTQRKKILHPVVCTTTIYIKYKYIHRTSPLLSDKQSIILFIGKFSPIYQYVKRLFYFHNHHQFILINHIFGTETQPKLHLESICLPVNFMLSFLNCLYYTTSGETNHKDVTIFQVIFSIMIWCKV